MKSSNLFIVTLACLFPLGLLFGQADSANMPPVFDHAALHVHDLQRSVDFYEKVMQLEKITEPFKDGRHVWFRIGPHEQLHLIGSAADTAYHDIDVHLAFRVPSLSDFLIHLGLMKVKYWSTKREENIVTIRPDGIKQVYLQDPDGYWIEVNDSRP